MSELPTEEPTAPEQAADETLVGLAMDDVRFVIDGVRAGVLPKAAIAGARRSLDMAAESIGLPPNWKNRDRKIGSMGGKPSRAVKEGTPKDIEEDNN